MSSSAVNDDKKPNPDGERHPADADDDSEGGERTVAQPFEAHLDPSVPLPISVPPPAMGKEPPKTTGTQRMAPTPARPGAPGRPGAVGKPPVALPRAPPAKPGAPAGGKASAPRLPLPPPPSARGGPPPPSARVPVAPRVGSSPEIPPASARTNLVPGAPQRPGSRESQSSVTSEVQLDEIETKEIATGEPFEEDDPTNDGPTMATAPGAVADLIGASLGIETPQAQRSPLAASMLGPNPMKPGSMSDAETVARADHAVPEQEETTRAVSREELFRGQDAQVVVGDDAIGDEATLAVPPEKLDAMKATGPMLETPKEAGFPPPPTPFAKPPGFSPLAQAPMQMPGGPPQSWPQVPAADGSYRGAPSSAQQPAAPFIPRNAQQAVTGPSMHHQQQQAQQQPMQQQAMWPPQPQARGDARPGTKITPQILALVGVGLVCLLIFVVGLYLFFTTKF